MAIIDQRLVAGDASVLAILNAATTHSLTTATATIDDLVAAIEAQIQTDAEALDPAENAETCAVCAGAGKVRAVNDMMPETAGGFTLRYPNETEDSVTAEDGEANPYIYCPLCHGDKKTAGSYGTTGPVTGAAKV